MSGGRNVQIALRMTYKNNFPQRSFINARKSCAILHKKSKHKSVERFLPGMFLYHTAQRGENA